jgi:hypothetical protein
MKDLPEETMKMLGITEADIDQANARQDYRDRGYYHPSPSPYDHIGFDTENMDPWELFAHEQYLGTYLDIKDDKEEAIKSWEVRMKPLSKEPEEEPELPF